MESFTAGLISLEDAQQKMLAQLTPITESLDVPLTDAAGRITACSVTSPLMYRLLTTQPWTVMPSGLLMCKRVSP